MRTWSLDDRDRVCIDGSPFWWTESKRHDFAQFIVDACNEKEARLDAESLWTSGKLTMKPHDVEDIDIRVTVTPERG